MMAKLKCKKCGKRKVELKSKREIKIDQKFMSSAIGVKILDMIADWTSGKYLICGACGYYEK